MSLQLAAQHLSSQGRGNDSTLVHMSPREVKSLNDLAMAHGGQLSINPQTGLPEAGFLSSILPMIAGAALTAAGVPAGMAAFGVGAGMTLMTGSLEKGLMAGLGAYGGASLGGSLMAGGATPDAASISQTNVSQAAAPVTAPVAPAPASIVSQPPVDLLPQGVMNAADLRNQINLASGSDFLAPVTQVTPAPIAPDHYSLMKGSSPSFQANVPPPASFMDNINAMGSNISPSSLMNFVKENPMSAASLLAPALTPKKPKPLDTTGDSDLGERARAGYKFDPGFTSPFPQPDPTGRGIEQSYGKARYYIPGKAAGGSVELQGRVTMDQQGGQFGQTGFGQQGVNGYRPAGNGFTGNNNSAPQAVPAFAQDPKFQDYRKQAEGLSGQMQEYMQKAPMYQQLQDLQGKMQNMQNPSTKPAKSPNELVGQDDPFFQSPEFKEYQNNPGIATHDMYYSPIFGQMGSGSAGRAQEKAYRKYKGIAEPQENSFNPIKSDLQGGLGGPQGSFGGGLQGGLGGLFGSMQQGFGSMLSPQTRGSNFVQQEPSSYADGGVATDPDRPTETPALLAFKQMQAQRAAQPPAPQIDANAEFAKYAQQTVGAPNQMQAPTMPAPTSTSLADSGYAFNPIKQQYSQITGTAPAELAASDDPLSPVNLANNFSANNPGVPHSRIDPKTGAMVMYDRYGNVMNRYASGGVSHLGDYSDGGRLLRGPGDGVSDSIPAMIGKRQPARLADGEFVVPARIVSELGNGSTEAGARKLYAMMDRIQKARGKTVGKNKVAKNSRSEKYLPA